MTTNCRDSTALWQRTVAMRLRSIYVGSIFFFFQAEDGIRDLTVTGVQTCALPISSGRRRLARSAPADASPTRCTGSSARTRRARRAGWTSSPAWSIVPPLHFVERGSGGEDARRDPVRALWRGGQGVRAHGETLSVARTRALVESAARIALPTALAPGIRDCARIESRWRSVSESAGAADLADLPPEHAAQKATTMASMRARIEASDVCRYKRCADIICRGAACCAPTHHVPLYTFRVISVATACRRRPG